jgi:RimJ/RimL family protein N-acetyltransferase
LQRALEEQASTRDPRFWTIVTLADGRPAGIASYLRITPEHGTIEIGHIWLGVTLRRTTAATEAMYLLAREAFDGLGHRRLEWKCNALNAASCRAAERLGFTFEGVFRQHMVVKGRNRDTAWYAITDGEWPAIRSGMEAWLAPENHGAEGQTQRRSLSDLIADSRSTG